VAPVSLNYLAEELGIKIRTFFSNKAAAIIQHPSVWSSLQSVQYPPQQMTARDGNFICDFRNECCGRLIVLRFNYIGSPMSL
jgi:hypothetical protein